MLDVLAAAVAPNETLRLGEDDPGFAPKATPTVTAATRAARPARRTSLDMVQLLPYNPTRGPQRPSLFNVDNDPIGAAPNTLVPRTRVTARLADGEADRQDTHVPQPVVRLEGRRVLAGRAHRPLVGELARVGDVVALRRRHRGAVDEELDLLHGVVVVRRDGERLRAAADRLAVGRVLPVERRRDGVGRVDLVVAREGS